jgi:hypothetical protein
MDGKDDLRRLADHEGPHLAEVEIAAIENGMMLR